jgi:hypothetical protein
MKETYRKACSVAFSANETWVYHGNIEKNGFLNSPSLVLS